MGWRRRVRGLRVRVARVLGGAWVAPRRIAVIQAQPAGGCGRPCLLAPALSCMNAWTPAHAARDASRIGDADPALNRSPAPGGARRRMEGELSRRRACHARQPCLRVRWGRGGAGAGPGLAAAPFGHAVAGDWPSMPPWLPGAGCPCRLAPRASGLGSGPHARGHRRRHWKPPTPHPALNSAGT